MAIGEYSLTYDPTVRGEADHLRRAVGAAVLPAPTRLSCSLDGLADGIQNAGDAVAGHLQSDDRNDRNERDDQRVLDERLTFLGPHLRQLDPCCEKLSHVLSSFFPSRDFLA